HGGYDVLKLVDLPAVVPSPGAVLVRMTAAAVNPMDNLVRAGYLPAAKPPPLVPGIEGAGLVESPGASAFPVGTRVMVSGSYGVARDGTWQEYVLAQPGDLAPIPENLSDIEAAAVPTAYLTAQLALTAGGLRAGQTVLAPAVGGSVSN